MTVPSWLYVAATGVVTAVGGNTRMTAAAVRAGVSGYARSDHFYSARYQQPITMACVPDKLLDGMRIEIRHGRTIDFFYDRIVRLAVLGIHEACDYARTDKPIPLILSMPELTTASVPLPMLIDNLVHHCAPWVDAQKIDAATMGRAAGIDALARAFTRAANEEYVLIGGSDSFSSHLRLTPLDETDRLLTQGAADGFAPGEGAGFVLLTSNIDRALVRHGQVIAVHPPGLAEEPGHLHSDGIYRGDGMDHACKQALVHLGEQRIDRIYSSMNGEHYWAKELGVMQLRNRAALSDTATVEHPADCFGDLGAATAPVLMALAADHLLNDRDSHMQLVCSSSDTAQRGAVVIEKRELVTQD